MTLYGTNSGAAFLKLIDRNSIYNVEYSDIKSGYVKMVHTDLFLGLRSDFLQLVLPSRYGFFGADIMRITYGRLERRDTVGKPIGEFTAEDISAGMFCSQYIKTKYSESSIYVNLGVKYIRQQIETEFARNVAIDLGVNFYREKSLFSVMIKNIGPMMKFINEYYRLPTSVIFNLNYLGFSVLVDRNIYDTKTILGFGFERDISNWLNLRINSVLPTDNLSQIQIIGGINLKYIKRFQSGYFFNYHPILGFTHQYLLMVKF